MSGGRLAGSAVVFLVVSSLVVAAACVEAQGEPSPLANAAACTPGESRSCACPSGREGAQVCSDLGDRFLSCECADEEADAGADGVADVATDSTAPDTSPMETMPPDGGPCGDIPQYGKCIGDTVVSCATPTGSTTPKVTTWTCKSYEECKSTSGGAYCGLRAGACYPGTTKCSGASLLNCGSGATWTTTSCSSGCITTEVGSSCATSGATSIYTGTLQYDFRTPGTTDWSSSTWRATAPNILIVSYDGSTVVDYTTTSSTGTFSLKVPSVPSKSTTLRAWLIGRRTDGSLAFAVARPGFTTTGAHTTPETSEIGSTASIVSGVWDVVAYPSGSTIVFGATSGGGYFRVYDYLRYAHSAAEYVSGKRGKSLVAWMQPNVSWDCGACYNGTYASVGTYSFASQIWIPMVAGDESYWSDAVTAHEVGHWAMDSLGRSPREGGTHFLNCATFPGQAWSEGWATLFSSMARDSTRYTDKQSGTYFWFDIGTRTSSGSLWPAPTPSAGLLQQIAENEVAGMGWRLTKPPPSTDSSRLESNARLLRALSSVRITASPFARGYRRHSWEASPSCSKSSVYEYSESVPMFADFLDALLCSGEASDAEVESAVDPATAYPYYPSGKICK